MKRERNRRENPEERQGFQRQDKEKQQSFRQEYREERLSFLREFREDRILLQNRLDSLIAVQTRWTIATFCAAVLTSTGALVAYVLTNLRAIGFS